MLGIEAIAWISLTTALLSPCFNRLKQQADPRHRCWETRCPVYLDLGSETGAAVRPKPELYLASESDKLAILDDGKSLLNVFHVLRGLAHRNDQAGWRVGHCLLLGPASIELLKMSCWTLPAHSLF